MGTQPAKQPGFLGNPFNNVAFFALIDTASIAGSGGEHRYDDHGAVALGAWTLWDIIRCDGRFLRHGSQSLVGET